MIIDTWDDMRYRLTLRRKNLGWTQRELGDILGVSRAVISTWETGRYTPVSSNLVAWCRALNLDIWIVNR